jgi:hypothetical protein
MLSESTQNALQTPIRQEVLATPPSKKRKRTITSPYFKPSKEPVESSPCSEGLPPGMRCHLIQETISSDLYALVVQAILWNQTRGMQARPVLSKLLELYPDAKALLQPIGWARNLTPV